MMPRLELYDPTGNIEVRQPHAKRLPSLEGKRIGVLTNEQWQAYFALPLLQSLVEQDFPGSKVLPLDTFPKGNDHIGLPSTARLVGESGVDAVIIGNAA
ncbi:MAG: UGSC family (seleno)protein [Betaproteobacteria bacterium]